MKLYRTPDGVFYGRRANAGPKAEIVETDTDANSLAEFINRLLAKRDPDADQEDEFTTVAERQDPPIESYGKVTIDLDDAFMNAPLGQQLTLSAIALENARNQIGRENAPAKAPQGYRGGKPRVEGGEVEDDPLFS